MSEAQSRTSILKAARKLMLKYGYAATSIDDICSKAGVTKGSLYHFFGTKEELGLAVLNGFYEEGVARVARGAYTEMDDPYQRLLGLFDHLGAIGPELWRNGCLMGNFACELAESSQIIRRRVAEIFEELVNRLAPTFRPIAGGAKEAEELAEQTLMVIEGAVVMARAHGDPNRIASGLRRFRRTIEARIPESRITTGKINRG
ncbi:MAG TPA: TetR/AcrR family transcriptional regulator [Candidatus Binataceae bacterium]|jgi:TetR/AcrR family transcriptional repressor of nem operon|nr:TetR/AcrR family transcriptional regulator [Candidatus Binataceae bacterium]